MAEQVVGEVTAPGIPSATVARLPSYLRALRDLVARGVGTTSSVELAELSGVGPAQLRKDLSFLGSFGTRGVGYDVDSLAQYITEALGLVDEHRIAIVGIGNLGHALANYSGYEQRGFHVAALLDASPDVVGTRAAGLVVEHVDALEEVVEREKVSIVVLATPAAHAQAVADRVVAAGVREILNFA
ncbi:MAG: redox-sensing transcriptional repressor Rex, partial [Cellulosimicrobium funkei]